MAASILSYDLALLVMPGLWFSLSRCAQDRAAVLGLPCMILHAGLGALYGEHIYLHPSAWSHPISAISEEKP